MPVAQTTASEFFRLDLPETECSLMRSCSFTGVLCRQEREARNQATPALPLRATAQALHWSDAAPHYYLVLRRDTPEIGDREVRNRKRGRRARLSGVPWPVSVHASARIWALYWLGDNPMKRLKVREK